jgi:hypothetical protein
LLDKYKDTIELRWEFLIRKKAYREDYKRCFGDLPIGHTSGAINFFEKHGIEPPINPIRSFRSIWKDAHGKADEEGRISWALNTLLLKELNIWDEKIRHDLFGVWGSSLINTDISLKTNDNGIKISQKGGTLSAIPKKYRKMRMVAIIVNLDAKSVVIERQVKEVVRFWKKRLGVMDGKKLPRTKKDFGLRYYKECLAVFDAYQKCPSSWIKIAKAVYKSDNLVDPDRARHQYKAAKKLINGGIRSVVL